MENYNVYQDIANRTGGDIYIGVVGPVRTGKSTFIKRFMEKLVLPLAKENERAVMIDELPQAAAGRTVMTTEPKFVPAKAARLTIAKGAEASVRLIDCVGFAVEGANGFEEDGVPRLVNTPWQDAPMPFEEAAKLGTEKVIKEHSTIGILVTTDGSITDLPRSSYIAAEERAVNELKTLEKPFVIVLNAKDTNAVTGLKNSLEEKYGVPVVAVNAETMDETEVIEVLKTALFEFPVACIDVHIPTWLRAFSGDDPVVEKVLNALRKTTPSVTKMRDCFMLENLFDGEDDFLNTTELYMDLGKGRAEVTIFAKEELFYKVLSRESGEEIGDKLRLMQYLRSLSGMRKSYERIQGAFEEAEQNGYGVAYPLETDYELEKPQLVKKSAGYAVQFKARAAGYHVVRVDIGGEVTPIIGTKEQSEEFIADTTAAYEEGGERVWETNIFGKSLKELVKGELSGKSGGMPPELRKKLRRATTRIVNEGKNNMICIVF